MGGAKSDAFSDALPILTAPGGEVSAELAEVMEAWPALPDEVKAAILVIIRQACIETGTPLIEPID